MGWFSKAILAVALLSLVALGGWIFCLRSPQDLRVTSLEVLRWRELPNSDQPDKPAEPEKLLLAVRFTSANLATFGHNVWFRGLYIHAYVCKTEKRISEGFNLVYRHQGPISFGEHGSEENRSDEYHVYLALQSSSIPGFSQYDLITHPTDVCIDLVPDMPYFGFGQPTNVMLISQSELEKVIHKALREK